MPDPALVHVYGQSTPHDSVHIVGNRAGLVLLKEAIDAALLGGKPEVTAFVNDGEGFFVRVLMMDSAWGAEKWESLSVPYSERISMEQRVHALWPWTFWEDSV